MKRSQVNMILIYLFSILVCLKSIVESSSFFKKPPRIVGGDPANITECPYQLALEYADGRQTGGASIINPYWAITAAHFPTVPAEELVLRSGSSYRQRGGMLHEVELVIRHPDHQNYPYSDYDVAVMKVRNPFIYSDVAQEIVMASIAPPALTPAVASGWGHLNYLGQFADQLQKVTVNIEDYDKCKQRYGYRLTPRMLCATVPDGTKDACQGDSGGPLVANNELVGIVSWGIGCAQKHYPGVYTNVAEVREWVISTIEDHSKR